MSKITMEFNLPEENDDYILASRGADCYASLVATGLCLETAIRESMKDNNSTEHRLYLQMQREFHSILKQNNIHLGML